MKNIVLDNSVILRPLLKEKGAEKVNRIFMLKDRLQISILVPDIFCYEFFNKLTRAMDSRSAMSAYHYLVQRQVSVIPFEEDLIKAANNLMEKYPRISFYDAAYHALAKAYNVDLITADERYYNLTKGEGHVKLLDDFKV